MLMRRWSVINWLMSKLRNNETLTVVPLGAPLEMECECDIIVPVNDYGKYECVRCGQKIRDWEVVYD